MITAELQGGLGNQMFQVAAAYVLALKHNDVCGFNFNRPPMLQGNNAITYRRNVFKHFPPLPRKWRPQHIYKENGWGYQNIPYHNDMMIKGYFSSEKYISDYRSEIVRVFRDEDSIAILMEKYHRLLINSVSIHVRRGDYLKFPKVYLIPGINYYDNALDHIQSIAQIDNILVFSDDIQWCRDNLCDHRITFIEGQRDYMDMYLMSLCNHNIIANSTFSWWGAYLNVNPDKIICAPGVWFLENGPPTSEYLFCDNWKII